MQRESGLRRPDVTGLSKTLWPSSHPAHTLQAEVHWPQGSRSCHGGGRGGGVVCVCLFVPEPVRGQVCVYVCVSRSRALGAESGSLLTATVAATLATQEGKCVE